MQGDDCLWFISPPSHAWTGETLHGGGTPALKRRVGQAECGLYGGVVADTGVEWAQNITDNSSLLLSKQYCSSKCTWLLAFLSHSRYSYAQGSAV